MRGPLLTASRNEPAPASSNVVTWYTVPPRPPVALRATPTAPGNARAGPVAPPPTPAVPAPAPAEPPAPPPFAPLVPPPPGVPALAPAEPPVPEPPVPG